MGAAVTLTGGEEKLKRACRVSHASADESSRARDVHLSSVLMRFCKFTAYSLASDAAGQNTLPRHKLTAARSMDGVKMLLTPPRRLIPQRIFFFLQVFK